MRLLARIMLAINPPAPKYDAHAVVRDLIAAHTHQTVELTEEPEGKADGEN